MDNIDKEPWVSVEGAVIDAVAGQLQVEEAVDLIRKYILDSLNRPI